MRNIYDPSSYRDVDFGPVGPSWPAWASALVVLVVAVGVAAWRWGMRK